MYMDTPPRRVKDYYLMKVFKKTKGKSMTELDFAMRDEIVNATSVIHFNNMKPGTVLFFNSWLQHQLSGSHTETPTRCVHFVVSHTERPCSTC